MTENIIDARIIKRQNADIERLREALEAARNRLRQGTLVFDDLDPEDKAVIHLADAALAKSRGE